MISNNQITINRHTLEAAWYGPAPEEAPTLIMLHEGLGCVSMWKDFPQAIAESTGCGVLVYSRYGYGASDNRPAPWPFTFMHHEGEVELPQIIQALGICEHFVIGHSDGGSVALIYAGSDPQPGLLGVITEAAHVFNEALCRQSIEKTKEMYESGDLKAGLIRYHGDNVDDVFWGWCGNWLADEWWAWNLEGYLPEISVPILIMQGEDDPYGTVAQVDAIAAGVGGPHDVCLLPDCQHTPHREQREATLAKMTAFVKNLVEVE